MSAKGSDRLHVMGESDR